MTFFLTYGLPFLSCAVAFFGGYYLGHQSGHRCAARIQRRFFGAQQEAIARALQESLNRAQRGGASPWN